MEREPVPGVWFTDPAVFIRDRLFELERARQWRDRDPVFERAMSVEPQPESLLRTMITDIVESLGHYLRKGAPRALLFGAVGFVVGWLFNVYIMVWIYDGFRVSTGGAATGRSNLFWGSMIWTVASVIVATLVSYRLSAGKERFWRDVREIPVTIRAMFRSDGDRAVVHVLWGFAGSMLAVLVLAPTFSGLMAVGILVALGTTLRPLVTGIVLTVWRAAGRIFYPDRPVQPQVVSVVVVACGMVLALAVGYVIQWWLLRVVVAIVAAGLAWFLAQRLGDSRAVGVTAVVMFTVVLAWVMEPSLALADDGGWRECGSSLRGWVGCQGSLEVLLRAILGGTASAIGAVFGSGLGDILAPGDTSDKKYADMTDSEKRRHLIDYLQEKYPGISPEDAAEAARQIVDGKDISVAAIIDRERRERIRATGERNVAELDFLLSKDFGGAFLDNLWGDLSSGEQIKRINWALEALSDSPGRILGELSEAAGMLWENRATLGAAALEWIATADMDTIATALTDIDLKAAELLIAHYRDQLFALQEASLAGDTEREAQIIGNLGGDVQFDVLLGAGIAKVIEKGGDVISGLRHADGPDAPTTPKNWAAEDPFSRPPMSVAEMEEAYRNLKPGDRIKLTPEEAAAWGGFDPNMLQEMRANSLLYGTQTEAYNRPWVELKRGSPEARQLRQDGYYDGSQHYDYNPKPNHIGDKSILPEELPFIPPDKDFLPGEVGSYRPTSIPKKGEVSDELYDQLMRRLKEADQYDAGIKTQTSGPVIDRYGKQVLGEAELGPDGRWYSRHQVSDANGVHPSQPGYQETWSDFHRAVGDTDSFGMGAGDQLYVGGPSLSDAPAPHLGYNKLDTVDGWKMTEADRLQYAASGGDIAGEGDLFKRFTPEDPGYTLDKYEGTIRKAETEGVVRVEADGMFLVPPGEYY